MDLGFGPDEWLGVGIVGFNEVIDVLPELFDRFEGRVAEGLALQDREPDFHLVEPGSPRRREMKPYVGMTLEPAVVFGFVGIEVVEDDMDGAVRMSGDDVVHEIKEFDAPPTRLVGGDHLAGGHLEGGEQRRGAVVLVVVTLTGQRPPVRKLEISLSALQQKLRCAIYTRKSTEEGLEMEFNSLDAQRESCEAYIASQQAEGWLLVPDRYDDGGFSGGTLERPALKRLRTDIEGGI